MARHPKDLPKRLRAQFKSTRSALVIDKHGRLRDRLRITAARWKALKAVNFDERLLQDLRDANAMEARINAGLEKTVVFHRPVSDFDLDVPEAHGGCQCSCHRDSGVMHCVPCCLPDPTLRPESP